MAGIVGVQYGSITIPAFAIQNTAPITEVDITKAAIFYLGQWPGNNIAIDCRITFANSQAVLAVRFNNTDIETVVNFCVLEFN